MFGEFVSTAGVPSRSQKMQETGQDIRAQSPCQGPEHWLRPQLPPDQWGPTGKRLALISFSFVTDDR